MQLCKNPTNSDKGTGWELVCVALRLKATGGAHDRPPRCALSARRLKRGAEDLQAHGQLRQLPVPPCSKAGPNSRQVRIQRAAHIGQSPNTTVPVNAVQRDALLETPSSGCSSACAAPQQRRQHNTDRMSKPNHGLRPTLPTVLQHTNIPGVQLTTKYSLDQGLACRPHVSQMGGVQSAHKCRETTPLLQARWQPGNTMVDLALHAHTCTNSLHH